MSHSLCQEDWRGNFAQLFGQVPINISCQLKIFVLRFYMAIKEGMKVGPDKVTTPLFTAINDFFYFKGCVGVPCFYPPELL